MSLYEQILGWILMIAPFVFLLCWLIDKIIENRWQSVGDREKKKKRNFVLVVVSEEGQLLHFIYHELYLPAQWGAIQWAKNGLGYCASVFEWKDKDRWVGALRFTIKGEKIQDPYKFDTFHSIQVAKEQQDLIDSRVQARKKEQENDE